EKFDEEIIRDFTFASEVITGVRSIRKSKNISFKDQISLYVLNPEIISDRFDAVIRKLGNISEINYVEEKVNAALSFRVKSNEYFIPVEGAVDLEAERKKMQEELDYTRGFLMSVEKKLSNERFVNNAPGNVVELEKAKMADAKAKIEVLEASLASLKE